MILIAPTSFKATIGAAEAAAAIADGVRSCAAGAPLLELPLSDGGPGLLDALRPRARQLLELPVSGPLGAVATGRVLLLDGVAVVESADACGLHLVPPPARDPLKTTTFGVGALLLAAAEGGRPVACGLGGSATVDGGAGLGRALGFRLLDAAGAPLADGGGALLRLDRIEAPAAPAPLGPVVGLVDVRSPLLGPEGAAAVFGPQKGADPAGVERLEAGLTRLAECLRRDLGVEVARLPGGGAAGGLGAGLVAFAGATLESGSEWVLSAVDFDAALAGARLVVTGEGAYDAQSALGKITGEVVRRATARGIPVLLLCGHIRTELPAGVTGLDGKGQKVTPARLARMAAEGCARLLGE